MELCSHASIIHDIERLELILMNSRRLFKIAIS